MNIKSVYDNADLEIYVKVLGQSRPADLNPVAIYTPPTGRIGIIRHILICNTSGASATYRLFLDSDGTTYDESTALFWDITVAANTTIATVAQAWDLRNPGNLAVRSSVASALTFTVFGIELK